MAISSCLLISNFCCYKRIAQKAIKKLNWFELTCGGQARLRLGATVEKDDVNEAMRLMEMSRDSLNTQQEQTRSVVSSLSVCLLSVCLLCVFVSIQQDVSEFFLSVFVNRTRSVWCLTSCLSLSLPVFFYLHLAGRYRPDQPEVWKTVCLSLSAPSR